MVSLYHKERESQDLKDKKFQEKSSLWVHSTEPQDIGSETCAYYTVRKVKSQALSGQNEGKVKCALCWMEEVRGFEPRSTQVPARGVPTCRYQYTPEGTKLPLGSKVRF